MATIEEIDAEIARREKIVEIDRLIEEKQGSTLDAFTETGAAVGGALLGQVVGGLGGIAELIKTGDLDLAVDEIKRMQQQAQKEFAPETEAGKEGLQDLTGALKTFDEKVVKPGQALGAGIATLKLTGSPQLAIEAGKSVHKQGLGKSLGGATLEATGSPALATVAELTPEIAELAIPPAKGASVARGIRAGAAENVNNALKALDEVKTGVTTAKTIEDVAEVVQKGTPEEIAAVVNADPKFYQAIDELNIDAEPLASFASKNPQFRSISNALEVYPGSAMEPQAARFIEATAQKADDLIVEYGGTLDKAQLGLDFKRDAARNIEKLYESADEVYGKLRKTVDETRRFSAPKTVSFLNELDAADKLSPKLKSVLNQLKPKQIKKKGVTGVNPATGQRFDTGTTEIINPKLGRIDILRKNFGEAVGKSKGAFKDQESGLNKALYAKLTDDLDNISNTIGGEALSLSNAGKGLVRQRKQLEDNLKLLLGKDLNKSLNVKVAGAVKGLSKSEVDEFTKTIEAIPKAQRGEIVMSAMNDVFKGSGVQQTAFGPTQFTKWYQTINRSPKAKKALFDALPKDSQKAIDNLFEVSRGVSRALGTKRATGVNTAFFNENSGFIRKMLGSAAVKTAIAIKGGPAASASAGLIADFIGQSSSPAKAASNLMSDEKFLNVIRQSVKEGVVEGGQASKKLLEAEKKVMKTAKYKKWADTLAKDDAGLLAGGLLGYLFTQEQN